MEATTIILWMFVGFFIARILLYRAYIRQFQKKLFYQDYTRVLNSPEFKVKGKYE
ncbi:MAG: hypothetical protein ACMXYF_00735 [Candidatus Woesearchaeota archaeon]